jgi:hypothetical protein
MTTIRETIKSQIFKARAVAFGFWLLFAGSFFLPNESPLKPLLFIPFFGFAASVLYILFFVKCPKCGARLGQAMSSMSKPNFCPGCGVSFDTRV